jgi:hypothetical protein
MVHIGDPGYTALGRTDDMLSVKRINEFSSAIRGVATSFEPRTTANLRIIADFPGYTTQRPLRIKVEHGAAPAVEMMVPDTVEKPGIHKVALIVREGASHDDVKGQRP